MIIFTITEIITVLISIVILKNAVPDALFSIADKGYKFDINSINEYKSKGGKPVYDITKLPITKVITFIPAINIAYSLILKEVIKMNVNNNEGINSALIRMSEKEFEEYEKAKSVNEKLCLILDTFSKENVTLMKKSEALVENDTVYLEHFQLPALSYTLDEVRKLNEITESDFKLGNVAGTNIAIIGIPYDCNVSTVLFKNESYTNKHEFKEIKKEDATNSKFVVYPFFVSYENSVDLQECVKEISKNRENNIDYQNENIKKLVKKI